MHNAVLISRLYPWPRAYQTNRDSIRENDHYPDRTVPMERFSAGRTDMNTMRRWMLWCSMLGFLSAGTIQAEWERTNGPCGGNMTAIQKYNGLLYTVKERIGWFQSGYLPFTVDRSRLRESWHYRFHFRNGRWLRLHCLIWQEKRQPSWVKQTCHRAGSSTFLTAVHFLRDTIWYDSG